MQKVRGWIEDRQKTHEKGVNTASDGRKTILDLLLQPEDGEAPLSKQSIVDETYSFCFAGTHTTSHTISMATYYLLSNPSKLEKLLAELKTATRNTEGLLEYRDVNRLPYLVSFFTFYPYSKRYWKC